MYMSKLSSKYTKHASPSLCSAGLTTISLSIWSETKKIGPNFSLGLPIYLDLQSYFGTSIKYIQNKTTVLC